jgi:cytochrome d ubiquinol oxidase subunit I
VLIPFFAFRVMVGCGLVMLALAWAGSYLAARIEKNRLLLWCIFLSFPLPYVAILTGWFTAEVGRQPWTVYGVLRTADAPEHPCGGDLAHVFCTIYSYMFGFGIFYIYRLLRAGPVGPLILPPIGAIPNRPMSMVDAHAHIGAHKIIHNDAVEHVLAGE